MNGSDVCEVDNHGLRPLPRLHQEAVGDDGGGEGVGYSVLVRVGRALHRCLHVPVKKSGIRSLSPLTSIFRCFRFSPQTVDLFFSFLCFSLFLTSLCAASPIFPNVSISPQIISWPQRRSVRFSCFPRSTLVVQKPCQINPQRHNLLT